MLSVVLHLSAGKITPTGDIVIYTAMGGCQTKGSEETTNNHQVSRGCNKFSINREEITYTSIYFWYEHLEQHYSTCCQNASSTIQC